MTLSQKFAIGQCAYKTCCTTNNKTLIGENFHRFSLNSKTNLKFFAFKMVILEHFHKKEAHGQ